jgi:hypothetical protein
MTRRQRLALGLVLALAAPALPACDSDADCGPGGTCIKRERRASGVCYGRAAAPEALPPASPDAPVVQPRPVTGERRERAEQWLGDPQQIIEDNLPGQATGAVCMVTSDCPDGWECVIAGFEGRCVKF